MNFTEHGRICDVMAKAENGKICPGCKDGMWKPSSAFNRSSARKDGMSVWCRSCNKTHYDKNRKKYLAQKRKHYTHHAAVYTERNRAQYEKHFRQHMLYNAKLRDKKRKVPFSITLEHIIIPEKCPVLGVPLVFNKHSSGYNSPSLDRIIPDKGYVPGNVLVVSLKANQIKNCSTLEELERVYGFYKRLLKQNYFYLT